MSYYDEENTSRLTPLAKIGFSGAFCALLLAGGMYYMQHHRTAPSVSAQQTASPETLADPTVAAFVAGTQSGPGGDATGSLPDTSTIKAQLGPVSGLPMPRFVSLKPDKVNVRQGPSRDQAVSFIFQKSSLPVEVIAEFENWRRIRDSDGAEGWVLQNLLSGKRTALIAPWSKQSALPLYARANTGSSTTAMLEPGVLASIKSCASNWCRIEGSGFDGWIEQNHVWGSYPGETID